MPDFPIVDAHLHLWHPRRFRYPWLDDLPLLNRPYLLDDYRRACGPVQVDRMVFVQCECEPRQYRMEVAWVAALAREDPRIAGIVAYLPVEKGEAVRVELAELARHPLIKGIRRIIQFEADPGFCLQPSFVEGVRLLADFGLSFDLCVAPIHLPNTIELVRQCPQVRFVLDHLGKPEIRDRILDPWREHLKTLAGMPNVHCKISGLATEADHQNWSREDLKPYISHAIECFGFDRVMFGGDWPVALQATEYPRWVETVEWAVQGCSQIELRKLFRDNAVAFYRLERE